MEKKTKIYIIVAAVILVIAVLVYNAYSGAGNASLIQYDNQLVPQAQISQLNSIAMNTTLANRVGSGIDSNLPTITNGTNLTIDGKPGVLYVGAEFCPYCAATRWSMIIALMRFGAFANLHYMTSSSTDIDPSIPTFTFYNSTYSSPTISFVSVETLTNTEDPLQTLSASQNTTFNRYDTEGIPFIDFGNKSIQSGADYNPGILQNMNWQQVMNQLNNSNSTYSQAIIGGADVFTAQICRITNNQPMSVCNQLYVTRILNNN